MNPPVPYPRLDVPRLRRRIVWIPTATLIVLILLDGAFELVEEKTWNTKLFVAHTVLLVLVTAAGLTFSTRTFNIIRRNHEEIHRQRSMLTSLERRSLAVVENSSDLVILLRSDGVVTYASPALVRTLGYSPEDWTGRDVLGYVHADDREQVRRRLADLNGESSGPRSDTFRLQHRQGDWRWISAAWTNLLADPHVEAIVCNARDISDQKQAQDDLAWEANVNGTVSELHRLLASVSVSTPVINELILRCARDLTSSADGFLSYIESDDGAGTFPATDEMPWVPAPSPSHGAVVVRRDSNGHYPGVRGYALTMRKAFFTNAPTLHPAFIAAPAGEAPPDRFLAVPVWLGTEVIGQIAVVNACRDYTERDLDAVGRVAECFVLAIQRKRAEEEVASVAKFPSENPHPILRVGPDGTILYANMASAPLLRMWDTVVGRPAPSPWSDMARDALATGATRATDVQCGDLTYAFSFVPIPDGRYANLYGRDVTDRTRAEEALRKAHDDLERRVKERTEELYTINCWLQKEIAERRRAEAELRAWFDNVPIGLYRTTRSGRILDANPALVQLLGFPDRETLLETNTASFYTHREDRERWLALIEQKPVLTDFEAEVRRRDGTVVWVRNSARAVRDAEGRVVYYEGGIEDITALKEFENELIASREQLRVLAAHLESVREEERTRIAREIHDELGQLLTGLKLDLSWLVSRLPASSDRLLEKTRSMTSLVDDTIKSVRRIATELRPGILDDLGLLAAIEWQTQEFQARTGIDCDFLADAKRAVEDREQRTALFRILQETLTNVARHAQATRVVVSLQEDGECFELRVEDNGRGITDAEIAGRRSLGLLGIQERARLLGGDVRIGGRPGAGTTIAVSIPVKHRAAPPFGTPPSGSPET